MDKSWLLSPVSVRLRALSQSCFNDGQWNPARWQSLGPHWWCLEGRQTTVWRRYHSSGKSADWIKYIFFFTILYIIMFLPKMKLGRLLDKNNNTTDFPHIFLPKWSDATLKYVPGKELVYCKQNRLMLHYYGVILVIQLASLQTGYYRSYWTWSTLSIWKKIFLNLFIIVIGLLYCFLTEWTTWGWTG